MQKRIECLVSGRVQMVMYRDFVTRNARRLGITGEVLNNKDGTVSVVAEGEEGALGELIRQMERGSLLARVDGVETLMKTATNSYKRFTIRYN